MWQMSPEFITDSTQHKIKFTVKKGQKETVPKKKNKTIESLPRV